MRSPSRFSASIWASSSLSSASSRSPELASPRFGRCSLANWQADRGIAAYAIGSLAAYWVIERTLAAFGFVV